MNGIPLRRVAQSYTITTATKVDVSGVKVDAKVNDTFFKKDTVAKKKDGDLLFNAEKKVLI